MKELPAIIVNHLDYSDDFDPEYAVGIFNEQTQTLTISFTLLKIYNGLTLDNKTLMLKRIPHYRIDNDTGYHIALAQLLIFTKSHLKDVHPLSLDSILEQKY